MQKRKETQITALGKCYKEQKNIYHKLCFTHNYKILSYSAIFHLSLSFSLFFVTQKTKSHTKYMRAYDREKSRDFFPFLLYISPRDAKIGHKNLS